MISVAQILRRDNFDYSGLVKSNYIYLNDLQVEYLVFDCQSDFSFLQIARKLPGLKYVKSRTKMPKKILKESSRSASHSKILFIFEDKITDENLEWLEANRINIFKNELVSLDNNPYNLSFEELIIFFKRHKGFLDRLKLASKYLFN